jgi:hypothetical protein
MAANIIPTSSTSGFFVIYLDPNCEADHALRLAFIPVLNKTKHPQGQLSNLLDL